MTSTVSIIRAQNDGTPTAKNDILIHLLHSTVPLYFDYKTSVFFPDLLPDFA